MVNVWPVHRFSLLMLHASQAFGAPAYLARALGCAPHDVYRWIAGAEDPGPEERRTLEMRLQGALRRRGALPAAARRWNDHGPAYF
jgi:hypothetical protein